MTVAVQSWHHDVLTTDFGYTIESRSEEDTWTECVQDRTKLLEAQSMTPYAVQVRSAWHAISGEITLVVAYRLPHRTEDNCEYTVPAKCAWLLYTESRVVIKRLSAV